MVIYSIILSFPIKEFNLFSFKEIKLIWRNFKLLLLSLLSLLMLVRGLGKIRLRSIGRKGRVVMEGMLVKV